MKTENQTVEGRLIKEVQNNVLLVGQSAQNVGEDAIKMVHAIMMNIYDENGKPNADKMSLIGNLMNTEYQYIIKTNVLIDGEKVRTSTIICFKNKPSDANMKKIIRRMRNGGHIQFIQNSYNSFLNNKMASMLLDNFWCVNHNLDFSSKNFYQLINN